MDYQKYFPVLAIVLVILAAIWAVYKRKTASDFKFYTGPEPSSREVGALRAVSLYGDSISVPSKLGTLIQAIIFQNWAVAGSCLTDLVVPYMNMMDLPRQIQNDPNAILITRYGNNDAMFDRGYNFFRQMLVTFVVTAREAGKVPVLCGLTNITAPFGMSDKDVKAFHQRHAEYDNIIFEVASRFQTHYIPLGRIVAFYGDADLIDGLHPNDGYSARNDEAIADYLDKRGVLPA